MLSFSAPAWLIGLALIPLIWWLHRLGDPDDAKPVSAVFLFSSPVDEERTSSALRRADPMWIFRAALYGLMVFALAGSHLPARERHVTVWFDDSLSMRTLEGGEPRTGIAARSIGAALDQANPSVVWIQSLSDRGKSFDASGLAGESRATAIAGWANSISPGNPRIPLFLPREAEHWLATDGADRQVNAGLGEKMFSRLFVVGSATENTAVTSIMARRSLQPDSPHQGSVRVHNLGTRDGERRLVVHAGDQVIVDENLEVAGGGVAHRSFRLPVNAATLSARLFPADALAGDDTLEIGLDGLRSMAVGLDTRCGPRLKAALRAHPGLDVATAAEADSELTVLCADPFEPPAAPVIRVHAGGDFQPVAGPVQWHRPLPGLPDLFLDPSWLFLNMESVGPLSGLTVLSSPGEGRSLIDAHAGSVEVHLDLESAPLVERPEYPLLVNVLVELAMDRPVLDPVARVARQRVESRIARLALPETDTAAAGFRQAGTDLAPFLLTLAMLMLMADMLFALPAVWLRGWASRGFA